MDENWTLSDLASEAPVGATMPRRTSAPPADAALLPLLAETSAGPALVELQRLGEGGMGVVHAATDTVLEREVAVKRPRDDVGARAAAALIAEARVLATLDHPNVVPVHALARNAAGAPVLVMKRVAGRRWSDLIGGRFDFERDMRIATQVVSALRFAHARGILHRDVKLDNVMVGDFGEVYLMDWGCACPIADSVTAEVVGTPTHMAPEMVQVGAPLGPHTDVFLVGATLHHALTGRPRHGGGRVAEVLENAWRCEPFTWPEGLPPELTSLIDRACARAVSDRLPTMDALEAALRDAIEHRHALRLAHLASARLPALRAAVAAKEPRADVLFAECRFGFLSALEAWADCAEAHAGLQEAFASWVPWKLSTGEFAAVDALLHEVTSEDAGRWRSELDTARARREHIDAEWRQNNVRVAARDRRNLMGALLLVSLIALGAVTAGGAQAAPTAKEAVDLSVVALGVALAIVIPLRRRIATHRLSRAVAAAIVTIDSASLLSRFVMAQSGASGSEIVRADTFLLGAGVAVLGAVLEPWLMLAAAPYLLAGVSMAAWPGHEGQLFPAASLSSLVLGAAVFSRHARDEDAHTG
jgi:serine/threonine-protein kinase